MLYYYECDVADVCVAAVQLVNFAVEKLQEHGLDGKLKQLRIKGWPVYINNNGTGSNG